MQPEQIIPGMASVGPEGELACRNASQSPNCMRLVTAPSLPHLSLGNSFPLLLILAAALGPPPWRATASFDPRSSTRASMLRAFSWNSGDERETSDGNTEGWYMRRPNLCTTLGRYICSIVRDSSDGEEYGELGMRTVWGSRPGS